MRSRLVRMLLAGACVGVGAFAADALRIEVVRGEGANNNATGAGAISAAVRVLDARGNPVAGALVVFSAPDSGATVEFAGSGSSASAVTDESGAALAPHEQPVGANGPLEIRVMASSRGTLANTVMHQMNLGVGLESARARELDVLDVTPDAAARAGKTGLRMVVRVQDGNGKPVPGATVVFTLHKAGSRRRGDSAGTVRTVSLSNGEATAEFASHSPAQHLEVTVEATAGQTRTTAYFRPS